MAFPPDGIPGGNFRLDVVPSRKPGRKMKQKLTPPFLLEFHQEEGDRLNNTPRLKAGQDYNGQRITQSRGLYQTFIPSPP
jgi:hypothetical protein